MKKGDMEYDLAAGAKRVVMDLRELARLTSDENGSQRVAWTPIWQKARNWFSEKAIEAGAQISVDAAGNTWAKIQGKSDESIVIGSHLDSVPNGGWLDGALGVVVSLEILRRYSLTGKQPEKTIYGVNWVEEEGARFGVPAEMFGSSAASGSLDVNEIIHLADMDKLPIADVLAQFNVHLNALPEANKQFKLKNIVASLELHIEQGPILEKMHKDVACVIGIKGVERHFFEFKGQAAHAGSFPIEMRHDAFLAAAETALSFKEIARKHNGVCTVGKVKVHPDEVFFVPDSCTISLDQRSIDAKVLTAMVADAKAAAQKAAEHHGVGVEWENFYTLAPTLFDKKLIALCKKAVLEEVGEETTICSGVLHDSAQIATVVPGVMMFAMSVGGLSHCREENTPDHSLECAIRAFLRLVHKVATK
jgi:hydantoinase/carbamoylase family amidase